MTVRHILTATVVDGLGGEDAEGTNTIKLYHIMASGNFNCDIFPSGQDTVRLLSPSIAQSIFLPLAAAVDTSVLAIHSLVNVCFMHTCHDKLMHLDKNLPTFHSYLQ